MRRTFSLALALAVSTASVFAEAQAAPSALPAAPAAPVFGPGAPPTAGLSALPPEPHPRRDWPLYGGIAAASVGVVSLVVMGVSFAEVAAYQSDPGFLAYRAGLPPEQHACVVARAGFDVPQAGAPSASTIASLCDHATSWYGAGVATAIVGSILTAGGAAAIVTSPTVWPRLTGKPSPWASRETMDRANGAFARLEVVPLLGATNGLALSGAF